MKVSHAAAAVDVAFDDPNLIADAGLVALARVSAARAPYGTVSEQRVNRRNGRRWDAGWAQSSCAVSKLRTSSYFPDWLLARRRWAEQALISVVATADLRGCLDPAGGQAGRDLADHRLG